MNNFVLMAEIVQEPQLRYTSDNQLPVTEMTVQFAGIRAEDRPSTMKVIGWGNLAQEIQEQFHVGDRVILEGRLGMVSFERPEGFRDKRAEMTAQRIHRIELDGSVTTRTSNPTATIAPAPAAVPAPAADSAPAPAAVSAPSRKPAAPAAAPSTSAPDPVDYDDIPF